MPNIKSAKKRVLVSAKKNERNRAARSQLRTTIKKSSQIIDGAVEGSKSDAFKSAQQGLDKAASKGIVHKNAASRKKSRLAKKANAAA